MIVAGCYDPFVLGFDFSFKRVIANKSHTAPLRDVVVSSNYILSSSEDEGLASRHSKFCSLRRIIDRLKMRDFGSILSDCTLGSCLCDDSLAEVLSMRLVQEKYLFCGCKDGSIAILSSNKWESVAVLPGAEYDALMLRFTCADRYSLWHLIEEVKQCSVLQEKK